MIIFMVPQPLYQLLQALRNEMQSMGCLNCEEALTVQVVDLALSFWIDCLLHLVLSKM